MAVLDTAVYAIEPDCDKLGKADMSTELVADGNKEALTDPVENSDSVEYTLGSVDVSVDDVSDSYIEVVGVNRLVMKMSVV
ncbi:hypothetical protein DPMN_074744 [Dreissena polymorpha]|uniref:Uncharacterized protein n=1 Tax=Dreissena polymorpha TaxID=45954 RepID=A0A9D4BLZ7_DREPO|nr:hypothetical protein DPMN_074744 [Dreissena polymorpha]